MLNQQSREKLKLMNDQGQRLSVYTISISNNVNIFETHFSFAYTPEQAVQDSKRLYETFLTSTSPVSYTIRRVDDFQELWKDIQQNIEVSPLAPDATMVITTMRIADSFKEGKKFVDNILKAAPYLIEGETEQKILKTALIKIKNLYGNPQVSAPEPQPSVGSGRSV